MALIVAAVAVFVAHLVKGITGFGSSLLAVPVLVVLWGPREAVFINACLELVAGIGHAVRVRHLLRPGLVLAVSAPMFVGQWFGTELLTTIPEGPMRMVVGVVIASFALEILLWPVRPGRGELDDLPRGPRAILAQGALAGTIGGVLDGLVGASGPPVVLFMRRWFTEAFFRAQLMGVFAIGAATLVPMLWWKGVGSGEAVGRSALLLVPLAAGAVVGTRLAGGLDRVAFGRLVGAVVLVAGLGLVATSG